METQSNIYIILPVYNAQTYIKHCLDSISEQTCQNFVCVIVDDGSTDDTNDICKSYTTRENFILLMQKNSGVYSARNNALNYILEHADKNDLLTFIDADDSILPNFFETVFKSIEKTGGISSDTLYFSGYNEVFSEKTVKHIYKSEDFIVSGDFRKDFESLDPFMHTLWKNFYNIGLIREKKIRFNQKLKRGADILFNLDYAYFVKNYVFINDAFYNYYVNQTSLSHNSESNSENSVNIRRQHFEKCVQFLTDCNIKNKEYLINKYLSDIVFREILTPFYKRIYELREYANPRFTRNSGQKRVIFCLKYRCAWIYRLYLKMKHLIKSC
ncbi:MAG: glycosyltransferase [Treponema sp.]|nr:glycosyltransferase [Treponema sp.]